MDDDNGSDRRLMPSGVDMDVEDVEMCSGRAEGFGVEAVDAVVESDEGDVEVVELTLNLLTSARFMSSSF